MAPDPWLFAGIPSAAGLFGERQPAPFPLTHVAIAPQVDQLAQVGADLGPVHTQELAKDFQLQGQCDLLPWGKPSLNLLRLECVQPVVDDHDAFTQFERTRSQFVNLRLFDLMSRRYSAASLSISRAVAAGSRPMGVAPALMIACRAASDLSRSIVDAAILSRTA